MHHFSPPRPRSNRLNAPATLFLAALLGLAPRVHGQSYCTAGAATPGSAGITKVVFNTINNSSSSNPAYTDFTSISTSVTQGSTYALSVTVKATGFLATNTATAWIDWNKNGVFDANEAYDLGTVNGLLGSNEDLTSNSPLNITVPMSAVAGSTRMRIRTRQGSAPPACGNVNNSEAEDYTVVVIALPVCSGTPAPGNTTTSNATPCPGATFTLGVQFPSTDVGLSYQWESSTAGIGGPFANNGLGTGATQPTTATVPTWYRVRVTCSGNTGISNPVLVTPTLTTGCYCTVSATSDDATGITYVGFNTISNATGTSGSYSNYSAISTTVVQGAGYPLAIRVNTDGNFKVYATAWIDWNRNGVFDANEAYDLGTATNVADGATTLSPLVVNVPVAAAIGNTIMRVRATYNTAATQCGNQNYSETEDYAVSVTAPTPCTGAPVPGNTTATNTTPCPGASFTLGMQNILTQAGLTYQWQSSTSGVGGPFANNGLGTASTQITNATVPTWYRVLATCGGNTGSSTPVLVTPTLATGCYCTVGATLDDATGITNVTFGTINNTSGTAGTYSNYSNLSATVEQGLGYPLSVRVNTNGNYKVYAKAWIDWNHNGVFDASEAYDLGTATNVANGAPTLSPALVNVPVAALTGSTIMRVRATYNTAATPCGNQNYSETEDYSVFVMPQHNSCATAYPVACGNTYPGRTTGVGPDMPANACPFNGAASTGGQNWWKYTATDNSAVTLSTCGSSNFDTRISVFTGADCSNLACAAMNDDAPGCANGGSQLTINTTAGTTYWIAVHGAGAAEGNYQLSVSCSMACPPPPNHLCAGALPVASTLANGTGTPATFNNACAPAGGPTACSGAMPVSGVWFSFNSGTHQRALLTLKDHNTNGAYTATQVNLATYSGSCTALGATASIACQPNAAGTQVVGGLMPNTEYKLLVYNDGGAGVSGSFGLMLEHPAHNDAAITAIISPAPGAYCGAQMAPQVTLKNYGDDDLTSVQINYGLSGGVQHTYTWTGSLPYGQSVNVTLPSVLAEVGTGLTLTIATSLPNGQVDEIPANDAKTVVLNTGGEPVVLTFKTGNNPAGFHWEVTDEGYNTVATGGNYTQANTVVNANLCLPTTAGTCFYLRLYDDYGDGLCCINGNGYWEVRTPTGGLLLRDLFDSSVDGTTSPSWGALSPGYDFRGHEFCLPTGPAYIETARCGVFNYALGNKIFCNKVTGATQYEFEFLDPDAGFMRRVTKTINYVQFWDMVVNPLTPGVKYFVRVRSDKNGPLASAHWGTGCEVGLGVAETVLCSGLIPAPLYGHSCNETRAFNTNNSFIYATPVTGATEYQFRITNASEGYDHIFVRNTYILQLKWNSSTAPLLLDGYTYDVSINVKVNGLYSGFCQSSCTITIANNLQPGGRIVQQAPELDRPGFTLWPNPNDGQRLNVAVTGLPKDLARTEVQVVDLTGRQVMAASPAVTDGAINTALDLNNAPNGTYLLLLTAGERTYTQRVVVSR